MGYWVVIEYISSIEANEAKSKDTEMTIKFKLMNYESPTRFFTGNNLIGTE